MRTNFSWDKPVSGDTRLTQSQNKSLIHRGLQFTILLHLLGSFGAEDGS